MVGQKLILSGLSKACSGLGGLGEGLATYFSSATRWLSCRWLVPPGDEGGDSQNVAENCSAFLLICFFRSMNKNIFWHDPKSPDMAGVDGRPVKLEDKNQSMTI